MTAGFILTLSCHDRPGIVTHVTAELYGHGANSMEAAHFRLTSDA